MKALICFEQPRNHPFITDSEREYLQRQIEDYENEREDLPPLPWTAILKSSPVWALMFSTVSASSQSISYDWTFMAFLNQQALYSWSFYIINNDLPKYLNDVLHVSIEDNSIYSSVPKVLSIVVSTGSGFIGDLMLTKCHIDRTNVRKVFVVLSKW